MVTSRDLFDSGHLASFPSSVSVGVPKKEHRSWAVEIFQTGTCNFIQSDATSEDQVSHFHRKSIPNKIIH